MRTIRLPLRACGGRTRVDFSKTHIAAVSVLGRPSSAFRANHASALPLLIGCSRWLLVTEAGGAFVSMDIIVGRPTLLRIKRVALLCLSSASLKVIAHSPSSVKNPSVG